MGNGTLNADEFNKLAESIAVFSGEHRLGWQIQKSSHFEIAWLVFKQVVNVQPKSQKEAHGAEESELELKEEASDCDENEQVTLGVGGYDDTIAMEYHVVYSESYQVPVLYFNAFHSNGKLLSLEEIWNSVPGPFQERVRLDGWSTITQQEHPILGRPFFQLHPCHTADLMKQTQAMNTHSKSNYIITWLSSVGPVVGLNLPLVFATLSDKG